MSARLSPAKVHSRLNHPVIDADDHWLEYVSVFSPSFFAGTVVEKEAAAVLAAQAPAPEAKAA
ncbi:MAG TPA: hypothetical protein VED01_15655 [Burkholderiales bacterium]|nr:hypothetical protein [Burkholderiales bacterium]